MLVIQVDTAAAPQVITLTYSDLHRQRFAFFQRLLAEVGAHWGQAEQRTTQGLNQGDAYHVGTARFEAHDEAELAQQLEGIGERIVFLIDWNRARKRLLHFVSREGAVAVLEASHACPRRPHGVAERRRRAPDLGRHGRARPQPVPPG